ncbi:MAG: small multi-drug export protein [Candidatus Pacearchaeota archaeon]|nr:small multi-drug export protein [Candidatus Pacearchaeota archaeon]
MDLRIIYAVILSILPISELRIGLPLAILFANDNNVPLVLIFPLIIMANILAVFIAFFFFDNIHKYLLKNHFYRKIFEKYMGKIQKKVDKFEKQYSTTGFLALAIFVAVPLPGTGAWTGAIIAWILGLDRKKSILAIAAGVIVAGFLVLLGTLGFLSIFS